MHDWNMGQAERRGYAISSEVIGLKTLLEAIHKIINDQMYSLNV
jgi:UDP:flavonoid glycosyltransferase YjiC (YdhE family)